MKIAAGILPALALCLAACAVSGPESDTGPIAARICAGVGTRADGSNWTQDEIGVTVAGSESASSTMPSDYKNVPYATEADGETVAEFTAVSDEIYFDGPSETTFTAYAPYEETASLSTLPGNEGVITRSTAEYQKDRTKIDFLFASGKTASSSSPTVNFVFDHRMSQIILNISAGVGVDAEGDDGIEGGEYTLAGLCHSGTFNVTTGETATVGEADGTALELSTACTARTLSDPDPGISYTLVVYPQTPQTLPFAATVGGKEYSGSLVIPTSASNDSQTDGFAAGYSYTYGITVTETGLVITECVIDKWIEADSEWGSFGPIGQFVYPDTEFSILFNSTPYMGTSGYVRIYNSGTGDLVDEIDVADLSCLEDCQDITSYSYNTSMDILHANPKSAAARYRVVWYKSLEITGTTLTIRPHSCVLDYDTDYYITVDKGVVDAMSFPGIGAGEWKFRTVKAPEDAANLTVGRTGYDVDCRTIQYALYYACLQDSSQDGDNPVTITVEDGTYEEQLYMYGKSNLTVKGVSSISAGSVGSDGGVKIQYSTSENDGSYNIANTASGNGASLTSAPKAGDTDLVKSGGMYVVYLENCSGIRFENVSFENTFSGHRVQAGAVNFSGDSNDSASDANFSGTVAFVGCTVQGRQAVIFTEGYNWFSDCLIGGNVDYIWGYSKIALFEKCELQSQRDLLTGSYRDIVQARSRNKDDLGYVLLDCDLTNDSVAETDIYYTYIARSPGSSSTYDNVACIGCVVRTSKLAGWYIMRNTDTGALSGVPNPSTADALHGWRYYNFTD
ncbi:MAG: pectinesterase family protein, partial [Prevotellaceae bacterium]|nr:pectinesterase family protein [Prevotellaceae bacterium]